jgi:hypothetical protein
MWGKLALGRPAVLSSCPSRTVVVSLRNQRQKTGVKKKKKD